MTYHSGELPLPDSAPDVLAPSQLAPPDQRAAYKPFLSTRMASLFLLAAILIAWEFGTKLFRVPKFIVPPLSDVLRALWRGFNAGPFAKDGYWFHSFITLSEVLLGFFIGSAIGLVLGVAIAQSDRLNALIRPYITAFQSVPKVAIAPIIIMWLGFGIISKVAIICMLTFFPVLITTIAGLRAVDQDRIDLLRSLSATRWQIFTKARFPSALPYIFAGLDMAAAFSVVGAIVGEFVGAQAGLGVLILQLDSQMDTGGSFSILIILSFMGIGLTLILRRVQRRILHWMPMEVDSPALRM